MSSVVQLRDDAPANGPAYVPPGEYELAFLDFETKRMFRNSEKLVLWFRVTDIGEGFGTTLARYYNVKHIGRAGRGGRFKPERRSECLREYVLLFNVLPSRLDRIPMTPFDNRIIRGRVRSVKKNYSQRKIPKPLQYSVIDELLELLQ